jgi:hypothetical protein
MSGVVPEGLGDEKTLGCEGRIRTDLAFRQPLSKQFVSD